MSDNKEDIVAFIDDLIARGEQLGQIHHRAYDNNPDSGVVVIGTYAVYPASQEEYSRWDTECRILLAMLGSAGKAFEDEFSGSTYDNAQLHVSLAPRKVGNLRAIKEAILRGRIRIGDATSPRSNKSPDRKTGSHTVHVQNVYGGLQIESPNATQNVAITSNQQFHSTIERLCGVVKASDLDEFDKEEIEHNLGRIRKLADDQPTEKSKSSILEKLAVVEKMASVSEKLAKVAVPLIVALRTHFG